MTERDEYLLGYRQAEQQRLQRQAQELAEESRDFFGRIGIGAGQHVVELGCGPQGCVDILAGLVGPTGRVVGIERSDESVGLARRLVADRALANVEVLQGDARATGLPRAAFDYVTARLVLVNVPRPEEIAQEAVALARPGGVVAFHEADWGMHICDPPLPAWDDFAALADRYARANEIDLYVGRHLPRLLRDAGLVDVQVHPFIHVYPPGHARRTIHAAFLENLRDRLLAQRLITEAALAEMQSRLRGHLEEPGTLVLSHLFVQVWGRKPAHP
jgi:SAM-dependent methyltransferase